MSDPIDDDRPAPTRELTEDELQRCADAANWAMSEPSIPCEVALVRAAIKYQKHLRYAWADAARAEAARILARDVDPRDAEIARLNRQLDAARDLILAGTERCQEVARERDEARELERAADAEIAILKSERDNLAGFKQGAIEGAELLRAELDAANASRAAAFDEIEALRAERGILASLLSSDHYKHGSAIDNGAGYCSACDSIRAALAKVRP